MKNGKRPTRKQKIAIESMGLNGDSWLVTKVVGDELHLVHRNTSETRILPL